MSHGFAECMPEDMHHYDNGLYVETCAPVDLKPGEIFTVCIAGQMTYLHLRRDWKDWRLRKRVRSRCNMESGGIGRPIR